MQGSTIDRTSTGCVAIHPLDPEDAAIAAAMCAMISSRKGARPGIEARGQFDALMERVLPCGDVTFEADTLGGVPGLWVHPAHWSIPTQRPSGAFERDNVRQARAPSLANRASESSSLLPPGTVAQPTCRLDMEIKG
jgi:hypothetical protein